MSVVRIDHAGLARRPGECGFRRASYADLVAGLALAQPLTGQSMVSPVPIHWIDGLTGLAVWVTGDLADGVFISVALSAEGVVAVRESGLMPAWLALAHLACEGQDCAGVCIGA